MAYYLRHYFNPDFDHTTLKPRPLSGGKADMRNLGYVQNVMPGQTLAELVPLESEPEPDPRFIRDAPVLPVGRHTAPAPDNPLRLVALEAGYVFYIQGLIAVKTLLNVRGSVDFHTGNIQFVGNIHVHHDVSSGFSIKGADVLVDGGVFGGRVRARGNLAVREGARGDFHVNCVLLAGRNMRVRFADKAELRARSDLDIGNALHSVLLVGGNLLVRGNLTGGVCRVGGQAVIGGDLGTASLTPTRIILGSDPFLSRPLHRCDERLEKAQRVVEQCSPLAAHLPPDANDCARRLHKTRRIAAVLTRQHAWLLTALCQTMDENPPSRLLVEGAVHPGVTVTIGEASLAVEQPLRRVWFERRDDAVVVLPVEDAVGAADPEGAKDAQDASDAPPGGASDGGGDES